MIVKRRTFLKYSAVTAGLLALGCGSSNKSSSMMSQSITTTTATAITSSLPIPPLLKPIEIGNIKHYDLTLQEGKYQFFKDIQTDTFGINGSYLGPTLLLNNEDEVSVNITNRLNESTTVHAHGMHVPANMDGGPHQIITPNSTWSARYRVNQKACTNWYHPHLMGKTAEHVYKGLAGLIIIEDNESKALNLPNRYGEDDIPLVLQDRVFDSDGQIDYSPSMREIMHGYVGDTFLTNGAIEPTISLEAKEIRFRILNGSNASIYTLVFDNNHPFKQIATDNSFLPSPVSLTSIRLSPGERAEIVVDLSNDIGKSLVLKDLNTNKTFLNITEIKETTKQSTTPQLLTSLDRLDPADAVKTREFTLSGRMGNLYINNVSMNINVINETIPIDQIEIWEVTNSMSMSHNFHIHATHFMILERNGDSISVAENEKGYKDTVYLPPNEKVKLIVKMSDYKDANNPYMYHCHFLEHEDAGMMGQFIVV